MMCSLTIAHKLMQRFQNIMHVQLTYRFHHYTTPIFSAIFSSLDILLENILKKMNLKYLCIREYYTCYWFPCICTVYDLGIHFIFLSCACDWLYILTAILVLQPAMSEIKTEELYDKYQNFFLLSITQEAHGHINTNMLIFIHILLHKYLILLI